MRERESVCVSRVLSLRVLLVLVASAADDDDDDDDDSGNGDDHHKASGGGGGGDHQSAKNKLQQVKHRRQQQRTEAQVSLVIMSHAKQCSHKKNKIRQLTERREVLQEKCCIVLWRTVCALAALLTEASFSLPRREKLHFPTCRVAREKNEKKTRTERGNQALSQAVAEHCCQNVPFEESTANLQICKSCFSDNGSCNSKEKKSRKVKGQDKEQESKCSTDECKRSQSSL